ncbi:ATP-binding cassette domain-containing protein [Synechococcus sp. FACHB-909]|uniref:ATP-binding cassette domain-containing protein n=1 Tax=Synechococcus sp. FACHB-909 TaxID=2692863 RepID=UPI001687FBD7|nr:ATP-binding cassette domain-containing protein [Synechococcus sp. FACHB-909]MBD2719219.1 ATP-binding cassette domain-containing protein [Synechococcus sp. FACHB-909]
MASAIVIEGLNHHFGRGAVRRQVLFDVALEVAAGEIVLLTGPSGSGKTTLLTLIGGLRAAQGGRLRVLGRELVGASPLQLTLARREHGYIFQAHNLHRSLTATQNVRMALEMRGTLSDAEMDRRARRILESVGLGDHLDVKPDQLSGGQKQRVAVARALVGEPPLLLADEPTAALDSHSGREVVLLMQRLAREQGCTILLVTHDSRILDIADRTLSLEDGRLC